MIESKEGSKPEVNKDVVWLDRAADVLDNQFRFPGTNFRFGIDAIIGLVPYIGDIFTVLVGTVLVTIMYRKGASGKLIFKMLFNLATDAIIGVIPLLGDVFDFRFRSHRRNIELMQEHYVEGRHRGSAWMSIIMFILMILIMIFGFIYLNYRVMGSRFEMIFG